MSVEKQKGFSEIIKERHSVRKYDANFTIPRQEIEGMLKEAVLAPSSSNLQPWRFIVIQDKVAKKDLRAIANNQEQVETSSAVIAVLGDKDMYLNAENVYKSAYEAGFIDEENRNRRIAGTKRTYSAAPVEIRKNIASFDAGLVSMQFMLIAKNRGYDTVPMGGFDKERFAERFHVPERFFPVVLIAIGKAAAPPMKTTRLPLEDILLQYFE